MVWRIRPQFGSPPKTAVLTSMELPIRRAAPPPPRRAVPPRPGPSPASWRPPRPSPDGWRGCRHPPWTPPPNRFGIRRSAGAQGPSHPDTPFAKSSTVSAGRRLAVDRDRLKVSSAARRGHRRRAGDTAASVTMNDSIVAMSGRSCPRPSRCPRSSPPRPEARLWPGDLREGIRRPDRLGRIREPVRRERGREGRGIPLRGLLHGERLADHTRRREQHLARRDSPGERRVPPCAAIASASRIPRAPIATFEQPLLTTTARDGRAGPARGRAPPAHPPPSIG